MPIEHWFSTPVVYAQADEETTNKIAQEFELERKVIEEKLKGNMWADNVHSTFAEKENLIAEHNLISLEALIHLTVQELTSKPMAIRESWVNYYKKDNYQEQHKHNYTGISGVYYIKTNEKDGNIRFHSQTPMFEFAPDTASYVPKKGKILLFPSWVPHSVEANKTDDIRISLSFNLFFKD